MNYIFPMKPSEFKISISVESYVGKLLKMTNIATLPKTAKLSNYQRYRFQIFIAQIEGLNLNSKKFHLPIIYTF